MGNAQTPDASKPPGFQMPSREEMIKQFDKDGDGELSPDEQTAMRTAMQARFARGGRPGAARPNREEMMKRFDKNADGKLDEDELAAMRASFPGGRDRGRSGRGEATGESGSGQPAPVPPKASTESPGQ
ncbi:MAG: EF-hand domain-containing protein [Verrucomicrobiota bacterium]